MSTQFHFHFRVHIFDNTSVKFLFSEIFCALELESCCIIGTLKDSESIALTYIKVQCLCDIKTKTIEIKSCLA